MKHEYKKHEKELYKPKEIPNLLTVPKFNFFCIDGIGNPNSSEFKEKIAVLYKLSYTAKMLPKKGIVIPDYFEYTVYPLEGVWTLTEKGILEKENKNKLNKDELKYTIMIRQPNFITKEIAEKVIEEAKKQKLPFIEESYFNQIEEETCVQILHRGSYDKEEESFAKMRSFIKENNYKVKTLMHREIYLTDSRKTKEENQLTILRYQVEKL